MTSSHLTIRIADGREAADLEAVRILWREYGELLLALLGPEHVCLTSFESELNLLPGKYAAPGGALLLARMEGSPAGCVGIRTIQTASGENVSELRRLWVTPKYRRYGIGKELLAAAIDQAKKSCHRELYLDTVRDKMPEAVRLYRSAEFRECDRYNKNPTPGLAFFHKTLSDDR